MFHTPSFRTRSGIHLALLTLALLPPLTQADYQSGLDAYNAARYTTAFDDWKAVAEQPAGEVNPAIYAETHYAIGMLYWMGQGVAKDYLEASRWLHKAAELGNVGAQGKLGYLYTAGITVQKDYNRAFTWFSKAAKQGDVDGQYNLGIFYLNGWGTEQNNTLAAQYLAAASAQGDESAEAALQGLLPLLTADGKSKVDPGSVMPGLDPVPGRQGKMDPGSSPGRQGDSHSAEAPRHSGLDPESIFLPTTWIQSQNPNHYTIQIIGLSNKSSLENLVKGYEYLAPFAIYTLQRNNKPLYLLIQGTYPTVEAARKAAAKFPTAIQKPEYLWIRKFQKVQELIK